MTLNIAAQPDDATCGPTSLHAVYQYYGYDIDLHELIRDVNFLEEGGTLASYLGIDALRRGFDASIYSYNLNLFDPSWASLQTPELIEKLQQQQVYKRNKKFRVTSEAYIHFLELGGKIHFDDLTPELLQSFFGRGLPVLAGLSATYLYGTRREIAGTGNTTEWDDLRGEPSGHFVVLYGFLENRVLVADPYRDHPFSGGHRYEVDLFRLINAIMLGIVTYDANLLVVSPRAKP